MKSEIRKTALKLRKEIRTPEKDKKIRENLLKIKELNEAKNILMYYPLENEVNIEECLKTKDKNIYLPRVNGEDLEVCRYDPNAIKKGSFNIQEPCNEKTEDLSIIDAVIIPAAATDKNGYRIGYGKGYYDRLLKKLKPECKKIAVIYSELMFDTIYPDKYDVRCDIAVTEKFIIKF